MQGLRINNQLILNTAYPSSGDHSSIYMSETWVADSAADLKAAPCAEAERGALNPPLSCSLLGKKEIKNLVSLNGITESEIKQNLNRITQNLTG